MSSSKLIAIIIVIAIIMLFVYPIQSIPTNDYSAKLPTRHKRWTFNTWRLHGRRQLPNDFYSPKSSFLPPYGHPQYEIFHNEDNAARKIHERLSELFQELNPE